MNTQQHVKVLGDMGGLIIVVVLMVILMVVVGSDVSLMKPASIQVAFKQPG